MQKRVVRVLSYEGNPEWLDGVLQRAKVRLGRTLFAPQGTVKELKRVELKDGERLVVTVTKE